ncbi:MAG: NADH-quinone oxidoreductase subunit NuoH [Armatimonadetes bacterium]|nr:NADH-quinone oxidoreductase subunit NuoH [Armatimonadota bacterium]
MVLVPAAIFGFISANTMFLIWLERKVIGRIQNRIGPMLAGPRFLGRISPWFGGLLQTAADAMKLLLKEDILPARADKWVFYSAPVVVFVGAFMTYLVIPFGQGMIVSDLNIGVLYILAISSLSVIAIFMAGWSSNNKYSLLGGFRAVGQIITYEIPLVISILCVAMLAGSLKLTDIIEAQRNGWFLFALFPVFILFLASAVAEVNRSPFDIAEGESEIVAGFYIEYTGMRFAMFFLAEYASTFVAAALAATLFLGGWLPPVAVAPFTWVPSFFWFLLKTYLMLVALITIRWSWPRPRPDQFMEFGWKVLIPWSFVILFLTGLGIYSNLLWLVSLIFLAAILGAFVAHRSGLAATTRVQKVTI